MNNRIRYSPYPLLNLKMIKISNEVRIGIFATVAIAMAIWGYKFLKGEGVVDRSLILKVKVKDAKQISRSAPIYFRGINIGAVKDYIFDPTDIEHVTLVLKFNQNPSIPKNALVVLFSNGALGGEAVKLEYNKPCNGDDCAQNDDYLKGVSMSSIESFLGKPEELDAYVDKMSNGMNRLFDTLKYSLKQPDNEVGKTLRDVQSIVDNLEKTTLALSKLMAASSNSLNSTLSNVASITDNLKTNNEKISGMLTNLNDVSGKANTIDFSKINKATEGVGQSVDELKKTLTETQNSLSQLTTTLKKVNAGEGTVGKFATNDSVYTNLNHTIILTQALLQDLRLNPKRYINLNPFRKYKNYQVPITDPLYDSLQRRFNLIKK
jgi:phospholipid/cholesterol/gamma-HCH transport system substrate-binding protein